MFFLRCEACDYDLEKVHPKYQAEGLCPRCHAAKEAAKFHRLPTMPQSVEPMSDDVLVACYGEVIDDYLEDAA